MKTKPIHFSYFFFFILLNILCYSISYGQEQYSSIDNASKSVPEHLQSYQDIADHITQSLKSDKEKTRAIYIWITHNIQYDLSFSESDTLYRQQDMILNEVLDKRKGVCMHYSELFHAMGKHVGLKCWELSGYTNDIYGEVANESHAWNLVYTDSDSSYAFIDATWAAGHQIDDLYVHQFNDKYFLVPPKKFIHSHIPFDPIWQCLDKPISHTEFHESDYSKLYEKGTFAFHDSITLYEQQTDLEKLTHQNRRIKQNGISNNMIQDVVNLNANNIKVLKRNAVVYAFNDALDTLRYGISKYNEYIDHKNKRFKNPKLEDGEIQLLIDQAASGFLASKKQIVGLRSEDPALNEKIKSTEADFDVYLYDLEREQEFISVYLSKWKPFRAFVITNPKYW